MKTFAVLAVVLSACCPNMKPDPVIVAVETPFDASCWEACSHAQLLGCEFGQRSRGYTCTDSCTAAITNGVAIPTGCVARAKTCGQMGACE